ASDDLIRPPADRDRGEHGGDHHAADHATDEPDQRSIRAGEYERAECPADQRALDAKVDHPGALGDHLAERGECERRRQAHGRFGKQRNGVADAWQRRWGRACHAAAASTPRISTASTTFTVTAGTFASRCIALPPAWSAAKRSAAPTTPRASSRASSATAIAV